MSSETRSLRGARFAVLLVLLCLALSACTSSSPASRRAGETPVPSPKRSRSGDGPGGNAFDDGYAVWPQDTFAAAVEAPAEAWRDDPNAVAAQFASQVLGWSDARIKTIRFGLRTAHVAVSSAAASDALDMELRAAPQQTWSVLNVMPHGEYLPTVAVRGRRASIGVEIDGEAVAADVTVGYGGKDRTVTTHRTGTVQIDLASKPDTSGHFLILSRNGQGDVLSATGSTLPAGHYAAS